MGKMFRDLGLIPSEEVVEVSASDLITGFVGQVSMAMFICVFVELVLVETQKPLVCNFVLSTVNSAQL